jgi:2-polyprenyl-3-methyl-5-hydroxy-6-metoxy-1,4-benzoquinol methylase
VGFGDGSLLTTAAEFGYATVGLDLREPNVQQMRKWGFEAFAIDLEGYREGAPFDVVSMMDVLEHIPFPKRALAHASTLLHPDGLLLLSMPNSDAFVWKFITEYHRNPYWGEIEHYHNFGRRRLYALLKECGFAPVRYRVSTRYVACMEVIARKAQ